MSLKKLSVNSLVYALGPQIPKIVSLLMLPVLTPHLTGRDFGVFGTIMAYVTAITALKDLGLTTVVSVSFYKYPNRYRVLWNKLFTLSTIWSLPLSLILALVVYLILPSSEVHNFTLIAILNCIPLICFEPTKWLGRKYFQLVQKPVPIVSINIIAACMGILSNYITMVVFKLGYLGWFISSFVISFISFIPYVWLALVKIKVAFDFKMNRKWLKRYLAIGLPVLPHFYSIYLLDTSDRLILSWCKIPYDEIGIYSLAYTFGGYFAIVGNALGEASGPMYIKLYRSETLESEIKARNMTFLMQIVTLIMAFILALWMKEVFQLLIKNEGLKMGYSLGVLIIMSYSYRPIYYGPTNKLQYLLQTKELWKVSLMAGLLNVILNLIFVPYMGTWGAAISTFIALMFMGFRGYFLKVFKDNNSVNYYPLFWFCIISLSTAMVFLLKDINWMLKALISLFLFTGSILAYWRYRYKLAF